MGLLIAVEGIDAAGKHTQSEKLKQYFQKNEGLNVTKFDLPKYESLTGQMILDHLQGVWKVKIDEYKAAGRKGHAYMSDPSTYLFQCCQLVNRMECLPENIWKQGDNDIFIADRYNASAYAYGDAFGIDLDWLIKTHLPLPQPDLNIFLNITVEESFNRRPDRRDEYEKNSKLLETVRESYLKIFEMLGPSYVVVDASGTKEQTFEKILHEVHRIPTKP